MAKNRKRIKAEEAEVPLSSMIDVVFLLLIYFIVTQKPIVEETLLSCDLPSPSAGKPPKNPPTLLTIDVVRFYPNPTNNKAIDAKDANYYFLNKRRWKFNAPEASNDLRRQLIAIAKNDKDQTVIINCGPNAAHQKLVQLLDACSEAGLTKLNVVDDDGIRFTPPRFKTK